MPPWVHLAQFIKNYKPLSFPNIFDKAHCIYMSTYIF